MMLVSIVRLKYLWLSAGSLSLRTSSQILSLPCVMCTKWLEDNMAKIYADLIRKGKKTMLVCIQGDSHLIALPDCNLSANLFGMLHNRLLDSRYHLMMCLKSWENRCRKYLIRRKSDVTNEEVAVALKDHENEIKSLKFCKLEFHF